MIFGLPELVSEANRLQHDAARLEALADRLRDIAAFWRSRYHTELVRRHRNDGADEETANVAADAICAVVLKEYLKAMKGGDE